jgi:outer membrane protein assembly factor BamD (BamD/ComL family)
MKTGFAFFFPAVLLLFLFSCSTGSNDENAKAKEAKDSNYHSPKAYFTDCKKYYAEARKMDSILLQQTQVDKNSANKAIKAFTDFAYYCVNDSLSPVFLIKTAQVARVINNIPQAKLALDKCLETYPNFKNRPAAIFLLAQLYDEPGYLNDEKEAKKLYEQIINEYPKSDWALSAQGAIVFLGKSDEEILKEFKKKNNKQ